MITADSGKAISYLIYHLASTKITIREKKVSDRIALRRSTAKLGSLSDYTYPRGSTFLHEFSHL
jgi:hypothetical protein